MLHIRSRTVIGIVWLLGVIGVSAVLWVVPMNSADAQSMLEHTIYLPRLSNTAMCHAPPPRLVPLTERIPNTVFPLLIGDQVLYGWSRFASGKTGEINLIDVSDPTHPQQMSALPSTGGYLARVAVQNQRAYVVDASGTVHIIDISDYTNPHMLGSIAAPEDVTDVDLANLAFDSAGHLLIQTEHVLRRVDVSNPHAPRVHGLITFSGRNPSSLGVSGRYAFVVGDRLSVIDLQSSDTIEVISQVELGAYVYMAATDGNTVYLKVPMFRGFGWGWLSKVDVSNPEAVSKPVETGYGSLLDMELLDCYGVVIRSGERTGLEVVDLADPSDPKPVAIYMPEAGKSQTRVFVERDRVYVFNASHSMWVYAIDGR